MKLKAFFYLSIIICLLALPAFPAVYHIDPDTVTSGDGTAFSPLKGWSELPQMRTGDDVFFKCGTISAPFQELSIDWEGIQTNPVIIGAYFMGDNGPIYEAKGARPIISGSNYTVPSTKYSGLIHVTGRDYIHVRNLELKQSGGHGVKIYGTPGGANAAYFVIDNIFVNGAYNAGILIGHNEYNYGVIQNSEVTGTGYGWRSGLEPTWPAAIPLSNCEYSYTTIQGNYVHGNWGEGISHFNFNAESNAGYTTIQDNVIFNNRRVNIYIDSTSNNIVRRNFCIGASAETVSNSNTASTSSDGRAWNQSGIYVNSEEYPKGSGTTNSAQNNLIYNNFIAGFHRGIGFLSAASSGSISGNKFYNNTMVANRYNVYIAGIDDLTVTDCVFKNNISYCPSGDFCQDFHSDRSWMPTKVIFDYNAWTHRPTYLGGPNDRQVDNNWVKTEGWQNLNGIPEIQDFAMTPGNPAIDNGAVLNDEYKHAIDMVKTSLDPNRSAGISVATIAQNKTGRGWDMGAVVFQNQSAPMAPPMLSILP